MHAGGDPLVPHGSCPTLSEHSYTVVALVVEAVVGGVGDEGDAVLWTSI